MSENELLQQWSATKDHEFLSLLLERLYELGRKKLSDKVSIDVLHNAILKMHTRIEKDSDIREVKSFFLKTLYNGLMDHYKEVNKNCTIPLQEEMYEHETQPYKFENADIEQLKVLEQLIRAKKLKKSRIKFLNSILIDQDEKGISRQNKFFHRKELKKTISLLDTEIIGQFFTYTRRVLKEQEDTQQEVNVQMLYEEAKMYKQRALSIEKSNVSYSEEEANLMKLFNYNIALQLYKQASALCPEYFKARFNIGFCFFKLERYDAAIKEFKAVLFYLKQQVNQSNFDVKLGSTLRNLGTIYLLNLKQYHKALDCFNEAIKHTPTDNKVRLGIIFSACKLNDTAFALEHLKAFDKPLDLEESITDWTTNNEKVKHLTISIYKESDAIRNYIPIEKII